MDRVLEESGKWFLNASLVVFATLIIQPIAQDKVEPAFVVKAGVSMAVMFAVGAVLLYLSKRRG